MDTSNEIMLRMLQMYGKQDKADYYTYFPKVVRSNSKVVITVRGKFIKQKLSGSYIVLMMPYNDYLHTAYSEYRMPFITIEAINNEIQFEYQFEKEQGYFLKIATMVDKQLYLLFSGMIYALDEDLFRMQVLKGDFHSHTIYSDGFESPDMVICAARKCGLDFLAITDHNSYDGGSIGKIERDKLTLGITVIAGEEYSSDFTNMHIISLGAKKALDRKYISKGIESSEEVRKILASLPMDQDNKLAYACTQNLIDKIHSNGGIAVMCHTFWKPLFNDGTRKDVPESLVMDLLRNNKFEAYEIVTGSPLNDEVATDMQKAFVNEVGLNPFNIAYLGVTDSHMYSTDVLCGKHYTIVFSKENTEESILNAVRDKRTVAVEIIDGKIYKCYGTLRYIKYAHFLGKYVFPQHDQEAYLEGLLAQKKIEGSNIKIGG